MQSFNHISVYQNESEVSSFAEHPGVGGEHEVGGERVESLAPHLRKSLIIFNCRGKVDNNIR